jgi:transcriptional antiterminator NusG
MNWYVLFAKTGYEQKAVDEISRAWKIDDLNPFIPTYDMPFRRAGKVSLEKRLLFPGYIFIESEINEKEFYVAVRQFIVQSKYALKLLHYGGFSDSNFAMKDEDREIFLKLYNKNYCIEMSRGFIEGDKIIIIDGPLLGFESYIKKINRHKMEAIIAIKLMGDVREIKVGLETVKKI